ncbi:gag-pol polyprotein [Tanacetum coccineum]
MRDLGITNVSLLVYGCGVSGKVTFLDGVSIMESKNVKEALTDPAWIESMQEELLQFKRLDVWVLVPPPDNIKPLALKWLFKNKHDEENTVIRNKTHLVMRGYLQEEGIDFEESFCNTPKIRYASEYNIWGTTS